MAPIVNGLAEEFAGDVDVQRLNAAEGITNRLQAEYGVRGHPSFVVLDGEGAVTQRFFGPQEEATLREAMAAAAS
jgi:hypothetical protein